MKLTNEQLAQWRNLVERGVKPTKPGDDTFTYFRDELKLLDHIDELESELARERASAAALLEGLAKKWKAQCPGQPETFLDDYWRGFTVKGQACAEELLAAITTDQASLGGASPSDPKPAKGNPPATERSART